MTKIITIDESTRIKIIAENFMLQHKIKTRNKRIAWHADGFFPDLISLSKEYMNNAPYRNIQGTEDFEKLTEVIKTAEANLRKAIEKINQ
ncbi:hypothetical protein KAS41_04400 [Candidatus Parcubacteria bacterium]|nr:hypothetical protein [Candidatus Parcubacteria bacterium]